MASKLKKILLKFFKKIFLKRVSVVLVVSTGRTGTKFFKTIFQILDANAIVEHEPNPDLLDLSILKVREERTSKFVKNYIINKRGGLLLNRKNLKQVLLGKNVTFVESNNAIFPLIYEYSQVFKKCDIIYVTRDPKSYIISAYNKDPLNDGRVTFYSKFDHRRRLTAIDYGETDQNTWEEFHRYEKIAWYWNKCNLTLYNMHQSTFFNSLMIKFEELFLEDHENQIRNWNQIADFAGFSKSFSKKESEISFALSLKENQGKKLTKILSYNDFDKEQKEKIANITYLTAKKLNYSTL